MDSATHWHVAYGLAGYGPDGSDGFAAFETLGEALEYARDELSTDVDMAHETAHGLALHASQYHAAWKLDESRADMFRLAAAHYADAWTELERSESLEVLRMNLDPKRREAPLYVDNPSNYAALQESQADNFPVDVSHNTRLYLWECEYEECEHYAEYLSEQGIESRTEDRPDECDGYVSEPAYGDCVVSLDGRTVGTAAGVEEAFTMLARAMRDSSYWPNAWHVNERGNTTLVVIEDYDTGQYRFTNTAYV